MVKMKLKADLFHDCHFFFFFFYQQTLISADLEHHNLPHQETIFRQLQVCINKGITRVQGTKTTVPFIF